MTKNLVPGRAPVDRVDDIPRILEAMRQAVREALLDHKRAGNPVAVWRNNRVEWIQPEDSPVELDDEPAATAGDGDEEPGRI